MIPHRYPRMFSLFSTMALVAVASTPDPPETSELGRDPDPRPGPAPVDMDKGYRNTPTGWRPVYVCRSCGAPSVAGSDVRCKPCGYVGKTRRNK